MFSHAGIFASKLTVGTCARNTAREAYSMASYCGSYYYRYYAMGSMRGSMRMAGSVK